MTGSLLLPRSHLLARPLILHERTRGMNLFCTQIFVNTRENGTGHSKLTKPKNSSLSLSVPARVNSDMENSSCATEDRYNSKPEPSFGFAKYPVVPAEKRCSSWLVLRQTSQRRHWSLVCSGPVHSGAKIYMQFHRIVLCHRLDYTSA